MSYSDIDKIRSGKGGKAYRKKRENLKRRVAKDNLPCVWCGKAIDTSLDKNDPMSFTADHPKAVANGGHISDQELEPMHRRCNSQKGNKIQLKIEQNLYR